MKSFKRQLPLYWMILPPLLVILTYCYAPMFGLVMAFQRFEPLKGFVHSEWVGLYYFKRLLIMPDIPSVVLNTVYISALKIVFELGAAVITALLLNELGSKSFKRSAQTAIYFPYFLSWVILGGLFRDILGRDGVVNNLIVSMGGSAVQFLTSPKLYPWTVVATDVWQQTGFGTIVFLAAITNVSPHLYEAASIDGAGRLRQTLSITLPCILSTIVVVATLSLGNILYAGFDQILMTYSPIVYATGDVIDTWVYRQGLENAQYSIAAAVGLFRSVVSLIMVAGAYLLAYKTADYRIF